MEKTTIFYERLKDIMFEKNISVDFLANELSVDISSIYKWLRNTELPSMNNLIKIADYFSCSIDYLLGRSSISISVKYKKCPPFNIHIQTFIKKQNITEYRICKDTKISRANFYTWKTAKHIPLPDSLIRLADYFDCSIDYLIGRED